MGCVDDPMRYKKNTLEFLFKKRKRKKSSTVLRVYGLLLSVGMKLQRAALEGGFAGRVGVG